MALCFQRVCCLSCISKSLNMFQRVTERTWVSLWIDLRQDGFRSTLQTFSGRWYGPAEGGAAFSNAKTPKLRWEVKPSCSPLRHRCVYACIAEVLLAVKAPLCSLQGCLPSTFKVELAYLMIPKHAGVSFVPCGSEWVCPSGFWVFSHQVECLFFKVESECLHT